MIPLLFSQELLLVFDIDKMAIDEPIDEYSRDMIVRFCHVLKFPEFPLRVTDRKEMFGHMLKAGGTCAHGIGVWSDVYIAELLRYVDSVTWMADRTMQYGLYSGSGEWMEHVWPRCDVEKHWKLGKLLQVNPQMKVASCQQPGLQPSIILSWLLG